MVSKLPILEVVLLNEIKDPQISHTVRIDSKCWGISDLDAMVSYIIFDRIAKNVEKLGLTVINVLAEGSVHELIHSTMSFDYKALIACERNIYAITYIMLSYFRPDYVKKRLPKIFKNTLNYTGVGLDYFKMLRKYVIDVRC